MIIRTLKVINGRNFINGQPLAHFVWNHYNPNNPYKLGFVVHHKDRDTLNDHISNLQLMTRGEHNNIHKQHLGKNHSEETKRKLSEFHKGSKLSEETKKKIGLKSLGNKYSLGRKASEETRKKMSESRSGEKHFLFNKHQSEETKNKISLSLMGNTNTKGIKLSEQTKKKYYLKSKED